MLLGCLSPCNPSYTCSGCNSSSLCTKRPVVVAGMSLPLHERCWQLPCDEGRRAFAPNLGLLGKYLTKPWAHPSSSSAPGRLSRALSRAGKGDPSCPLQQKHWEINPAGASISKAAWLPLARASLIKSS